MDKDKTESGQKFIEIVNWTKAQCISKDNAPWLKFYTSILDNDRIAALDDKSFRLITGLWALAARMGVCVFPADPNWLMRRMAFLHSEPDLEPLMKVKDIYGHSAPFIRYCEAPNGPKKKATKKTAKSGKKAVSRGKKAGNSTKPKKQGEQSRVEKRRAEQSTADTETLTGLRKEEREKENKTGLKSPTDSSDQKQKEQKRAEQNPITAETDNSRITGTQQQERPQNPSNPMESEAGAVRPQYMPKQPLSARCRPSRKPERIGHIISGYFPEHWRDAECQQFGWDMVVSLGMRLDPENMTIRSEAGSFASWLYKLKKAVSIGTVVDELKQKGFDKARYICVKAKRVRNRSAIWFKIMAGELASRGITLPDSRASPAAVIG